MLLVQSPSLVFAFMFAVVSLTLTVFTFNIGHKHPKHHIQFLIILPPLNSIFLFLFSLTWIERRFRLSYIPLICLLILLLSSLTLTIASSFLLSLSVVLYFSLVFYAFSTAAFLLLTLLLVVSYLCGLCHTRPDRDERNDHVPKASHSFHTDHIVLKSNEQEFILFMSQFPGSSRRSHEINHLVDDLNEVTVDAILTLNETKELSFTNMKTTNLYNMDVYSMHIKRASIEHIVYPIRKGFIPKSISDYIQFLYGIISNVNRSERNRLLVHCMSGLGRTGMTVACLELLFEYITSEEERAKPQKFVERFCHYPCLLKNYCRVCQAIANVREARPRSIRHPLQILFVHEFYARLKSPSYMQQIKAIMNLNEQLLSTNFEELRSPSL